jgi:hypothetical protein
MVKAPLARDAVGRNPRVGEKRTKRSMAVESPRLPVGVTFSGANRHKASGRDLALDC